MQTYLPQQPPQYPTRLEAGTLNGHGIAGLSAALDYLEETGLEAIRSHEQALAGSFTRGCPPSPASPYTATSPHGTGRRWCL